MTLEKWIEHFHSYNDGGVVFDYDKRTELLFFLEELKEKRCNRKEGMTRTENNAWYLLCGILMGMVLCFLVLPGHLLFQDGVACNYGGVDCLGCDKGGEVWQENR